MAVKMPSLSEIGEKWASVSATRGQDYTKGVSTAGNRWQEGVNGAESQWAEGVTQALSRNAYSAGVNGKGAKYQEKAMTIGGQRWTQGISASRADYERGFGPIAAAISSVTLPPRGARGNPGNLERVRAVNDAARQAKLNRS